MTRIVAILTLAGLAAAGSAETAGPITAVELLPLPASAADVTLASDPFARTVTVAAAGASPAVARALRSLSRALCPEVTERDRAVVLTCRSTRVVARVVPRGGHLALELRELEGLPATGAAAMPLVFHDPLSLGLGSCPGENHAARGECRLREGRTDLAAGSFLTASRSPSPDERAHALLRLGDLALAAGDVDAARRSWSGVATGPWKQLADARRCELDWTCAGTQDEPFAREGLTLSMAREMALRHARARAFRGELAGALWGVAEELGAHGACGRGALFCRLVVLSALRGADEGTARDALAIYAGAVTPGDGPLAAELAIAAAAVAERSGAPGFAAALFSTTSRAVPEGALDEHLLRTARLYVAAEDPVRARVVADFLRGRRDPALRRDPRFGALLRDIQALRARKGAPRAAPSAGAPELVAAARAISRARATYTTEGARQ